MQNRKWLSVTLKKALVLSVGVMVLAMSMAWAGPLGVAGEDSCTTLQKHQAEVAHIKDVMSSIQLNEDGSYTSESAFITWIPAEASHDLTRDKTPMRASMACWVEAEGIFACCHGSFCCVVVDGIPYCG
jgi:hypothetical protein